MNGWFITLIVLYLLSLGIALGKHGEPKNETYNFWGSLIGISVQLFLIYKAIEAGL